MTTDNASPKQLYQTLRTDISALTIKAEEQRARQTRLATELDEVTQDLEDTLALITRKEVQAARFAEVFPEELQDNSSEPVKISIPAPAPKVHVRRVQGELTFPEVIREVLGDQTMNTRQVLEALAAREYQHSTSNPESNTATTLSSYSYAARDANDKIIRNTNGKGVKVKPFIRVGRGSYRNATEAEIQAQIKEGLDQTQEIAHIEPSQEIEPDVSLETATEILASQGILASN